jgi:MerR family copper efflux transcriptional regulator
VVHLERQLVAIGGNRAPVTGDEPGVVDQHVDGGVTVGQLATEGADVVEAAEVDDVGLSPQRAGHGARLARRPPDHDQTVSGGPQLPGGGGANAVAGPRDHHQAAFWWGGGHTNTINYGPYSIVKRAPGKRGPHKSGPHKSGPDKWGANMRLAPGALVRQTVLIGEVARHAGVSRDTVRLYTRLGLVTCRQRPAGSRSYADYDESAAELIRNIKVAQSIGFTLAELRPIAAAYVAGRLDDDHQRELLQAKLAEVENKRRQLGEMARFLRSKLKDLDGLGAHPGLAINGTVSDE